MADNELELSFPDDDMWQAGLYARAHKIAAQWGELPAEHLAVLVASFDQSEKRQHLLRIRQSEHKHELDMAREEGAQLKDKLELARLEERQRQDDLEAARLEKARRHDDLEAARLEDARLRYDTEMARIALQTRKVKQAHWQHLAGVGAGVLVSLSCIGGAIWFGASGNYWPMGILVGPVLIVLIRMFLLRTSEAGDTAAVGGFLSKVLGRAPITPVDPGDGTSGQQP